MIRSSIYMLFAIVSGIFYGTLFQDSAAVFSPFAQLFLNSLNMLVLPLVVTSVITSITGMATVRNLSSLGLRAGGYFLISTISAAVLGAVVAGMAFPFFELKLPNLVQQMSHLPVSIPWTDHIATFLPKNLLLSIVEGRVLPVIVFSLLLGVALRLIEDTGKPVVDFIAGLHEALMKIVFWVIAIAPFGVFCLMVEVSSKTGVEVIENLSVYLGVVIVGLLLHAVVLLGVLKAVTQLSPFVFLNRYFPASIMAFSTSSSLATLPVMLDCLKRRFHISDKVIQFVCPLGVTVNMDGTALYHVVSAFFIAQVYGISLTFQSYILIIVSAVFASIAVAGIPNAGLIMMMVVFNVVGLPFEGIGLILLVDRFVDMVRTFVNVLSDGVGTICVDQIYSKTLKQES